ncbi:hypothetical protein L1887_03217 [Cichorium endivia]|nr:hypothetical protein L1887_03217 [Cichorium endivia]
MGMAEKAMVVLSSLAAIEEGKTAIVEEGGIAALVEVIGDSTSLLNQITPLFLCLSIRTHLLLYTSANGFSPRSQIMILIMPDVSFFLLIGETPLLIPTLPHKRVKKCKPKLKASHDLRFSFINKYRFVTFLFL